MDLILLGSDYGGWVVPDVFNESSICYFADAGEDITFDVEFVKRYGCNAHVFDPTPRAIKHCKDVISAATSDDFISPIPASLKFPNYQITPIQADKIKLHPIGLGREDSEAVFYPPANLEHVSYSILNLQDTTKEEGFVARCDSISNIMKRLGHDKIDCLKLDIEGAELMVLEEILNKKIAVDTLCIEFDYIKKFKDPSLETVVNVIVSHGYSLVSTASNHTFIRTDILKWDKDK